LQQISYFNCTTMKRFSCLLPALLLALLACTGKKAPEPTAGQPSNEQDARLNFTIEPGTRIGLITADKTTREAVLAAYGDKARVDSVYLVEGMMGEGVVLFPDEPRRTAYIYWDPEVDAKRPALVRITGDTTGVSDWKTTDGITIGTPITEVERLNGQPFEISGFGWDYGGMVINWNGGKLGEALGLTFQTSDDKPVADRILGEGGHLSSEPDVVAAGPKVSRLEPRILAKGTLPACLDAKAKNYEKPFLVVKKMTLNGVDHYWFNDGVMAVDGVEYVYDANCKELCRLGGMRQQPECSKVYDQGKWEVVWEK
jgi:hypothetical protein